jgi:predicted GNAT family N-acyltransferase
MTTPLSADGYGLLPVTEIPLDLLNGFTCGKPRLDAFLHDRAVFFHRERLGFTWVVVHDQCADVVAYFTLSNDALTLTSSEEDELGLTDHAELQRFPAVNIGRLAVAAQFHQSGVSGQVMRLALDAVQGDASLSTAARLVVVDADNDEAVLRYYERHGFVRSLWADKQATHQGGKRQTRATIKMLRDILVPW